jgi:hypothetical protein
VVIEKENTTIINGGGKKDATAGRIAEIRNADRGGLLRLRP